MLWPHGFQNSMYPKNKQLIGQSKGHLSCDIGPHQQSSKLSFRGGPHAVLTLSQCTLILVPHPTNVISLAFMGLFSFHLTITMDQNLWMKHEKLFTGYYPFPNSPHKKINQDSTPFFNLSTLC